MVKGMATMLVGKRKEGLIGMEGGLIGLGKNWLHQQKGSVRILSILSASQLHPVHPEKWDSL